MHSIALSIPVLTVLSGILGACDIDTSHLTAVQEMLNVVGMLIVFSAVISEGKLTKYVRRFVFLVKCVWKAIALRRRRAALPPSRYSSEHQRLSTVIA